MKKALCLVFLFLGVSLYAASADQASNQKLLVKGTFMGVDASPTFVDGRAEYLFKSDNSTQKIVRLPGQNPRLYRCPFEFAGDKMNEGDLVKVYEFVPDLKITSCQPMYQVKILKRKE